ncbi:MAG: DNA glycosylase [Candidatus Dojkabacteria bacterium]|nr:DNA glycosylase [Candidatus Dojkabacteria bacterium]MDQ7020367.1 DNA glycosylase [Candidatus Dojkabacteria bacterium]
MNTLKLKEAINLDTTLVGGQSFNWELIGNFYYGSHQNSILKISLEENTLHWQSYPVLNDIRIIEEYFRLSFDYESMIKSINKGDYINDSIVKYPGLRLLKQDLFETIISFIISQNKNITSIRKTINLLKSLFGKKLVIDNRSFSLFPNLEELSLATSEDLKPLGVGYRDKYIISAIEYLTKSNLLERYKYLSEDEVKEELLKIKGIGNKAADCILTFS